jgi:hypothetical protein
MTKEVKDHLFDVTGNYETLLLSSFLRQELSLEIGVEQEV